MACPDVADRPTRYTSVTIGPGRFLWKAPRTVRPNGHAMLAQQQSMAYWWSDPLLERAPHASACCATSRVRHIYIYICIYIYIVAIHIHMFTYVRVCIYFRLNIWCTVWNSCSRDPAGRPISAMFRRMGGMLLRTACPDVADRPTKHAWHGSPATLRRCTDMRCWQPMAHISGNK
jgi:hypothetical protein